MLQPSPALATVAEALSRPRVTRPAAMVATETTPAAQASRRHRPAGASARTVAATTADITMTGHAGTTNASAEPVTPRRTARTKAVSPAATCAAAATTDTVPRYTSRYRHRANQARTSAAGTQSARYPTVAATASRSAASVGRSPQRSTSWTARSAA